MNNKSKTIAFLFISALFLTVSSCKKEKEEIYMSEAKIIGIDNSVCPCCGGYIVSINDYQYPASVTHFLASEFPAGFTVNTHETFPISVKLDWSIDTVRCDGKYINVPRIARD